MGTVYPASQQTAHHPLKDGTQSFDTYAPAPDTNMYGTPPQGSWGQWWSPEDAAFAESANMAAPSVYTQDEPQYSNYTFDPKTSAQWASPATSTHSYPIPFPATEPISLENSTGDAESRRGSSSTEPEKRKHKRNTTQHTAAKSTRRASTKPIKSETALEKPDTRGSRAKPASQPTEVSLPDLDVELDDYSRKVQERNRIASNKFRVKKREDAKKLQADKEDMERANRNLSSCASDLTLQVYELKMKLWQHTDCDCHLIQDYIANEAHRYIQDLGDGKQPPATPSLQPQHHHNQ